MILRALAAKRSVASIGAAPGCCCGCIVSSRNAPNRRQHSTRKGADLLLVHKVTKFQRLQGVQFPHGAKPSDIASWVESLQRKGVDTDKMIESHHAHQICLQNLKVVLEARLRDSLRALTVRRIDELNEEHLSERSAVISVGGDGTFLKVASMIHRPELLLAGVNSDPHNSAGSLCTLHHDKSALHAFLEKLLLGAHEPFVRSRLKCSLHDFGASSSAACDVKLPLALNEIFIASNDPSAVSSFAVSVDGGAEFACKNSGILLSTGTGSAAWYQSARSIHSDDLNVLLGQAAGATPSKEQLRSHVQAATRHQSTITLPASSRDLLFLLRESIPVSSLPSGDGRPKFKMPPKCFGTARTLRIRSFGSDISIFFDSMSRIPFLEGKVLEIEVAPPSCSLSTV